MKGALRDEQARGRIVYNGSDYYYYLRYSAKINHQKSNANPKALFLI